MVKYKGGRLHASGVSFPMVEGYFLNAKCGVDLDGNQGFYNEK